MRTRWPPRSRPQPASSPRSGGCAPGGCGSSRSPRRRPRSCRGSSPHSAPRTRASPSPTSRPSRPRPSPPCAPTAPTSPSRSATRATATTRTGRARADSTCAPFGEEPIRLVLPAGHPAAASDVVDLADARRRALDRRMPPLPRPPARARGRAGLHAADRVRDRQLRGGRGHGRAGHSGWRLLPALALAASPRHPGVVTRPTARRDVRSLHLVTARGAERVPAVGATHRRPRVARRRLRRRRTGGAADAPRSIAWTGMSETAHPPPRPPPAPTCACASARRPPARRTSASCAPRSSTGRTPGTRAARFVFRIEDTDAARDSEESYEQLLDALTWLGLDWDEGIGVGGPHEPYRQSQRGEIYADVRRAAEGRRTRLRELLDGRRDRRPQRGGRAAEAVRLRQLRPRPHRRAARRVPRRGPRAGAAPARARRRPRLRRPRARPHRLPGRRHHRLRGRAPQRRAPVHAREPRRRRADGHHARAARRGPALVDPAADRALPRAHRHRRHHVRARASGTCPTSWARATRSSPSATPSPTSSTTAIAGSSPRASSTTSRSSAGDSRPTATCSAATSSSPRSTSRTSTRTPRAST